MIDQQITDLITEYTLKHSNFETRRNYISLSNCYLSVDEIVSQYRNGFTDTLKGQLKCYKGYQMEHDLVKRIIAIYGDRIKTKSEISGFEGLVKGHPDFTFDDYPADCKSVLMDKWLPDGRFPRKVYWQMQGYMKYSRQNKALVVYESRETGILKASWVFANIEIQNTINQKLIDVIKLINI